MRWAMSVSAYSSTAESFTVGELRARKRIGWSAGLTFWYEGGVGIPGGSWEADLAIAAWTSWAAASMSRVSANCSVIWLMPSALVDVIESRPAMVENCFSRGV